MRFVTNTETGNTSFGDEIIRTPEGAAPLSRCECGRDLEVGQRKLCRVCAEKQPARRKRKPR